ncbi:agmatinase [Hydromonas duriensis]|uniref:Agmatinase n=1 Tax=Hydromonas duriensis TaxID=1527608 RepID=A0A4R6Y1R4_9BURK|nr:agmatinase [Hydromonas duriensis]TDR29096.1 agmatinase [Hydromonas duriensis]
MGFAYMSQNRFLAVPHNQMDTPFAVAGVPYDGAVTHRPGARFGPDSIRRASHMLCDGTHPFFDVSPFQYLSDVGDLMLPNTSIEGMRESLAAQIPELIQKYHMCWLGGDHSITLGLLRAYRAWAGQPLAVLHFDAHCDTWEDHFGEPSGHGTWVYEAIQEGLVDAESFVQIGIRSAGVREAREYVKDQGGTIFTARDMRGLETLDELKPVLNAIRQRMTAKGLPLYMTVDIDHLDPAFAPGTGTPEPGGMTTNQTFSILEQLADLPWVGMDCVEVAPAYDYAELTSNAAAQIVWTYVSGQVAKIK